MLRGIRVSSGLMLRYGADGLLELLPETTIAQQHPNAPNGTNATELLNDGWPAFEFSDGVGQRFGNRQRSERALDSAGDITKLGRAVE